MEFLANHYLGYDEKVHEKDENIEVIKCKNCRHNGSFDTDCPIIWDKTDDDYCSFAES